MCFFSMVLVPVSRVYFVYIVYLVQVSIYDIPGMYRSIGVVMCLPARLYLSIWYLVADLFFSCQRGVRAPSVGVFWR